MIGNHPSVHGGITSVIDQLLTHDWEKDGISMSFIPSYNGGNVVNKIMFFASAYHKIKKYVKKQKPDVVHIHMSHHGSYERAYLIYKLCKKNNISIVAHLHGSEFQQYFYGCIKKKKENISAFFEGCSTIIVLGEEWRNFISSIAVKAKITVLNNTVCIPEYTTEQPEDVIDFLFLGVLFKRKGVADLLSAVVKVVESGVIGNKRVKFNIAGTGPEEVILREYVAKNKLDKYVNFLGWIAGEEKIKQLSKNQVFVLPSYNEGLPVSILEALSFGMPVISTQVGSISEVVMEAENGFLVEPGDIEGIAKAITEMIFNYTLRCRMAKQARRIAETRFNEESYFERLAQIYIESR